MKPPKKAVKKAANPSPAKPDGHDLSKDGHDLSSRRVTNDEVIGDVIAARAKLAKVQRELAAVTKDRDELLNEYEDLQKAKYPIKHVSSNIKKTKDDFIRIIANDVHGSVMDMDAVNAFLIDLKKWNPDEIILNGDIIECGGFLATHHTLGFVSQTEYTFQDDIAKGNWFLDEVQKAAPKAVIHFIAGNHEDRVERWIVDQTLRNTRESEFLRKLLGPEVLLKLKERGINYYTRGAHHVKGLPPGWIKLGKVFFTHELGGGKNAASAAVSRTAGNVVFAHCFSEDTEVMTPDGWTFLTDLKEGDAVGTMSLTDASFEWQNNTGVYTYDHYKELVHMKNSNVDIMVTDEHAMVTMPIKVKNLEEPDLGLKREITKDLIKRWKFKIPLASRNTQPEFEELTDDEIRMFVWIITEGCVDRKNGRGYIRISQSDTPNGGMKELDALLARMGLKFSKNLKYSRGETHGIHRNYDAYTYYIARAEFFCDKFHQYCPDKHFENWVLNLSSRQFNILFDTMMITDGNPNKDSPKNICFQYSSKDLKNVDIIQAACAMNSIRTISYPRVRHPGSNPVWVISICKKPMTHISTRQGKKPSLSFVKRVPYSGKVACCSVPNQTLILRRNGKVFVAGNTHQESSASLVLPAVGLVKAWNPGCLCQRQPLWRNSNPTNWSHGYAVQFIAKSGEFLHLNIPIWQGSSMIGSLHHRITG